MAMLSAQAPVRASIEFEDTHKLAAQQKKPHASPVLRTTAVAPPMLAHLANGDYKSALDHASLASRGDERDGGGKALDFYPVVPASLALLGRIDEAKEAWKKVDRQHMRHSARFTGARLEVLAEGLRLAGWDGRLK